MVSISKKASLAIFFAAGSIFIGIGIASIIDSNIPRFVQITEIIKPNQTGIFTPDMNIGNIANIFFNKSNAGLSAIPGKSFGFTTADGKEDEVWIMDENSVNDAATVNNSIIDILLFEYNNKLLITIYDYIEFI